MNYKLVEFKVHYSGETLQRIPITQIDGIMCFGNIHITRAVILESFNHELPIIFLSQSGHWQGIIRPQPSMDKKLLTKQLHHHNQPLPLAKVIIAAKLQNSLTTIKRYLRYHKEQSQTITKSIATIKNLKNKLAACKSIQSLTGIEGSCAKFHFQIMQEIIPQEWHFKNRNRRPPSDPINALLSLGYTLLFNNIYAFVMHRGLIMELGFLHSSYNQQPALGACPRIDNLLQKSWICAIFRFFSANSGAILLKKTEK